MTETDRQAIAARIRALIGGRDGDDLEEASRRLGVEELSLRLSTDDLSPHPTVEVIQAVVKSFGVDPSWLLTGTYSATTHAQALGEHERITARELRELILSLSAPVAAMDRARAPRSRPVDRWSGETGAG